MWNVEGSKEMTANVLLLAKNRKMFRERSTFKDMVFGSAISSLSICLIHELRHDPLRVHTSIKSIELLSMRVATSDFH